MAARKVGSGHATQEADACARLLAAHFSGDSEALRVATEGFAQARRIRERTGAGDGRGFTAEQLSLLFSHVPRTLGVDVVTAEACDRGEGGDVVVTGRDGTVARVEIKAQLTRPQFDDIQNADWVRDATDFLGELLTQDSSARGRIHSLTAGDIVASYQREDGWDLGSLWVADIAGAKNRAIRHHLGIDGRGQLETFLGSKYVLHATMEGVRLFRLSELPNLLAALNGGLRYDLRPQTARTSLIVWTNGNGQVPQRGSVHLSYYVGQRNRGLGGHHMSKAFFFGAKPLLLVKLPP
jgi:hypothetical protein